VNHQPETKALNPLMLLPTPNGVTNSGDAMMSKKTSKSKAAKVTKPSKAAEPAAVVQQAGVLADADDNGDGAKLLTKQAEEVSEQRTDDAPAVDPAPAAVPAPAAADKLAKEPKAPKAPAAPKDSRNGVTRPATGNKCAAVWDACDALKAEGKDLTFVALRPIVDSKIADATVRTQWSRFRKYNA
jgi:hypothetical protein